MPQFDFGTVLVPQLFWLAVFFVVLYFGIVRLTLPRLGKVMDERTSKIDADLAAARLAKSEADATAEHYRLALEADRETARTALGEAQAAAAAARAARRAAADRRIAERTAAAEARIDAARQQASASLREVAAEGAQAIVARLTGTSPADDEVAQAVDRAMVRAH
ncbi:MAG: F0F1 ATP synthase subunit B' [Cypionkella sp.]